MTVKSAYGRFFVPNEFEPGIRFLGKIWLSKEWYFEMISVVGCSVPFPSYLSRTASPPPVLGLSLRAVDHQDGGVGMCRTGFYAV